MTRLLHAPIVDAATRRLDAPAAVLDQATRELVARAEAEAHARGRAEGAAEAREAADHATQRVAGAVAAAVEEVRVALRADDAERTRAVVDLARELAEAILARELDAGGTEVVDRVLAAVDALDHGPFTVHLAPMDADLLEAHRAALPSDAVVAVDPRLRPGEARITGPWSGADLTRTAMIDALLEPS